MSAQISLYAELLQNIRQVSLAASLPSPSNASTNATVTSDGSAIHLRHDGLDAQLALPASVDAAACPSPLPVQPVASSLSWRLPLATAAAPQQQQQRSGDEVVPWPATDLLPGEPVRCRGCGEPVVGAGRVGAWKDLPSENWAEMMEFWHCHKPDDAGHGHGHGHGAPRDGEQGGAAGGPAQANELGGDGPAPAAETDGKADEQSLASRGYGANSIISAQEGVGFVDLTSLLFAEGDCEGILVSFTYSSPAVMCYQLHTLHSSALSYIHCLGLKEGGQARTSLSPGGMVTDTNAREQRIYLSLLRCRLLDDYEPRASQRCEGLWLSR